MRFSRARRGDESRRPEGGAPALLEKEAVRFAESLDDYEQVSVTEIGGWGPVGFWLVVRDGRFGLSYEIGSHCDYWDFIGALSTTSSTSREIGLGAHQR